VVALEPYHEHFTLFTLDDSSGETVDVLLWKPRKPPPQQPASLNNPAATVVDAAIAAPQQQAVPNQEEGGGGGGEGGEAEHNDPTTTLLTQKLATLQIGSTVRAKGTLSRFRDVTQLQLLRLDVLADTSAEAAHIAARTAFFEHVLSKPWVLTRAEIDLLRSGVEADTAPGEGGAVVRGGGHRAEEERRERRERKRRLWEKREERHRIEIGRAWEGEERLREFEAGKAALDGSRLAKIRNT
jgi:hypothetical protein